MSLLATFLQLLFFLRTVTAQGQLVCLPSGDSRQGFRARVYSYTLHDLTAAYDRNYLLYEYKTKASLFKEWYGVTDPNFESATGNSAGLYYGDLYGQQVSLSNFTLELLGYFKAPQSGTYTLKNGGMDDGGLVFFDNKGAFKCCNSEVVSTDLSDITIDAYYQSTKPQDASFVLTEGFYYPMRITYANAQGNSCLLYTSRCV